MFSPEQRRHARQRNLAQNGIRLASVNSSDSFGNWSQRAKQCLFLLLTVNEIGFLMVAAAMFLAEFFICHQIIQRVSYTEIDWSTYMQQVQVYLKGQRNYSQITGDTGPIVYPAAHLYIYRFLYSMTEEGRNIRKGQYIFACFYLLNLALVFRCFYKSRRIPPFVLCLICLCSYRVHSIFLLRLFNDPIAMLLFFSATNCFISRRWLIGAILYSLAVGVKMNILLFAPALFFIFLLDNGLGETLWLLFVCGLVQCFLAIQFLTFDTWAYLSRAFELNRVFFFKWTVNWRFLSKAVFLDWRFHALLLLCHLAFLVILAWKLWFREQGGLHNLLRRLYFGVRTRLDAHDILFALFTANLAGITFARSLHYQFYCWYYYSIPYLLFAPLYPADALFYKPNESPPIPINSILLRLPILFGIELCWNTFPSTVASSLLLHFLHGLIIFLLFYGRYSNYLAAIGNRKQH